MMKRLIPILACWFFVAPVMAQSTLTDRMIENLASTQTLFADFVQTTAAKSARVKTLHGSFWIAKPGLLRWEVKKPYPQLQVLNRKEFWMYDPDLAQASVRTIESANLTGIAALLLNTNNLSRDELLQRYSFEEQGASDGLHWIRVVPRKPETGMVSLRVGVDSEATMRRFEIVDNLGQMTQVSLLGLLKNTTIDARLFQFTPPKGVNVLRAN